MAVTPVVADRDYPRMIAEAEHVEPAPRRVRATMSREWIFDSTRARYVWEWPYYPQYYIPVEDIDESFLVDEHHEQRLREGMARRYGLHAGGLDRPGACGSSVMKRSAELRAPPASTGTHWMPGMRRTSRSSSIPATPTSASTHFARTGTSGPPWTGSRWPTARRRSSCSRPACRPATTSTAPMSTSATSCPPSLRQPAPTRA